MLDPLFSERLRQHMSVTQVDRQDAFEHQRRQITFDAARKGMARSSIYVSNMLRAHEQELRGHAEAALAAVRRVRGVLRTPASEALRDDLKAELNWILRSVVVGLEDSFRATTGHLSVSSQGLSMNAGLARVVNWLESEVDLYVDELMNEKPENLSGAQLHFHAPVASVQTGSHATASVTQNIGSSELSELLRSIDLVRAAIEKSPELTGDAKRELLEVADDCAKEAGTDRPNGTRLTALFNVLGTTVQSLASARPAYDAMRAALLPFGLVLP